MAIGQCAVAHMVGLASGPGIKPLPDPLFWQGRKVLLTGHTGFKGAWLAWWLTRMGAQVTGLALAPNSTPSLYRALGLDALLASHIGDMRELATVKAEVQASEPEVVLHLAAQALVRSSYREPLLTFETNVMGSANLLEALRGVSSVKAVVMVTTDKVYRNHERSAPYVESDELGGHDPYSASKAASELVIASYRDAFLFDQGVTVAVARAGNVIGGGDWSQDRLLPDAVRAWQGGQVLQVRRPDAMRPWQHVLEPLSAYLCLAQAAPLDAGKGSAWNFGPDGAASVRTVVELARAGFGQGEIEFASESSGPHEAGVLALDAGKAKRELSIVPRWDLLTAVTRSMHWYRDFELGISASALCERDLLAYLNAD